jgi:hypothetical protein
LANGKKTVRIALRGNRDADAAAAREAAKLKKDPRGYTWHHDDDEGVMMLVPTALHDKANDRRDAVKLANSFSEFMVGLRTLTG